MRLKLLDAYCGAGGAGTGYARVGFDVTGVDIVNQPNYPYRFIRGNALDLLADREFMAQFDAVHASCPCQAHSDLAHRTGREYPDLIWPTRQLLWNTGLPYVIENVEGAPLYQPIVLCGTMFEGLRVLRHRLFECNFEIVAPPHPKHPLVFTHDKRKAHHGKLDQDVSFVQVTGGGNATIANKLDAMGIDWMDGNQEINEAIPPAYTEYVGAFLMGHLTTEEVLA